MSRYLQLFKYVSPLVVVLVLYFVKVVGFLRECRETLVGNGWWGWGLLLLDNRQGCQNDKDFAVFLTYCVVHLKTRVTLV